MRYPGAIGEVWVFGSFARGAPDVGDVDLAIELDRNSDDFRALLSNEQLFTWEAVIKRELFGRQRIFSSQFDQLPHLREHFAEDVWILLYAAGDSASVVTSRIDGIVIDANATRAPRPAPPAELGPHAEDIPVADREVLIDLMARGLLTIEPVDIPVVEKLPPKLRTMINEWWDVGGTRHHQVSVAATYLHQNGTRQIQVQRDSWAPLKGVGPITGATIGSHAPSTVVRILANNPVGTRWLMLCKTPKRDAWGGWICSTPDPKELGDRYWRSPW